VLLISMHASADANLDIAESRERITRSEPPDGPTNAACRGGSPALRSFLDEWRRVAGGSTPGHHPTVFGAIGGVAGGMRRYDGRLFIRPARRSWALPAALPRQLAGQQILWTLEPHIAVLAEEAQHKREDDIWSFAPALEIAGMRHARLDARLFRS
jgi:urease accessory protein